MHVYGWACERDNRQSQCDHFVSLSAVSITIHSIFRHHSNWFSSDAIMKRILREMGSNWMMIIDVQHAILSQTHNISVYFVVSMNCLYWFPSSDHDFSASTRINKKMLHISIPFIIQCTWLLMRTNVRPIVVNTVCKKFIANYWTSSLADRTDFKSMNNQFDRIGGFLSLSSQICYCLLLMALFAIYRIMITTVVYNHCIQWFRRYSRLAWNSIKYGKYWWNNHVFRFFPHFSLDPPWTMFILLDWVHPLCSSVLMVIHPSCAIFAESFHGQREAYTAKTITWDLQLDESGERENTFRQSPIQQTERNMNLWLMALLLIDHYVMIWFRIERIAMRNKYGPNKRNETKNYIRLEWNERNTTDKIRLYGTNRTYNESECQS